MASVHVAVVLLASVPLAAGHGSVVYPPTRNSVDRNLPPWKGGKHPDTGDKEPFGCVCSNGTKPCDVGQSCFWFSNGCTIGCDKCDGNGARIPNSCRCGQCANSTVNDPKYRTANRHAVAGSEADTSKYNPWRSPGKAPVFDACGMAGGTTVDQGLGGVYNTTIYAKLGDLGSKVLPETPTGTVWIAGGNEDAAWYIRANHGGGYQYRLCPKSEPLTEECFQKMPIPFSGMTRFKWENDTEAYFQGTFVSEGTLPTGSTWAMNPMPAGVGAGFFPAPCSGDTPIPAPTSPNSHMGMDPNECSGNWPTTVIVIDTLKIPADITPGEYVLGWRWDCEETAQIWASCSDITIAPATTVHV